MLWVFAIDGKLEDSPRYNSEVDREGAAARTQALAVRVGALAVVASSLVLALPGRADEALTNPVLGQPQAIEQGERRSTAATASSATAGQAAVDRTCSRRH